MANKQRSSLSSAGVQAEAAWEAVLSVGVALAIGYYADRWFGTEPVLLLVFLAVGCVTGFRRLMKLAAQTNPPAEQPSERGSGEDDRSDE